MKPQKWFDALHLCQSQGTAYVLITLLATAGSTPRDGGCKMIVTGETEYDTIGGGHLEFLVTQQARDLLAKGKEQQIVEHYPLASKLGQCCGGTTNVLFEVMIAHAQQLAIFGAGHVAKALVPILAQLPLQIIWVDQRAELFPTTDLANNVSVQVSDDPTEHITHLATTAWVLIMTHNHQLDFDLVSAAIKRPDIDYIGMIGSHTKARRFQTRLGHKSFKAEQIERLISPVGLIAVPGKKPIEVAVSIAAQLITMLNASDPLNNNEQKLKQQWLHSKHLQKLMAPSR
ncbi:MAG: xanthine dehydrogenase accessory factor [Paraglaciecola sp.]